MEDQPACRSVRLLGPVEAGAGDLCASLGTGRLAAVLALLAVESPSVVMRGRLIDQLWGADPPASAVNAVQVQISRLRAAFGADLIERVGDGYRVPSTVWVDTSAFRDAVARGLRAAEDGDLQRARDLLADAEASWRGPALAGLTAPGAVAHAGLLEELRHGAAIVRLECEVALGRHRQVLTELRALGVAYPFDEQLLGLLMTALYRSGRQEEALAVYADGARRLSEELGVDPTPQLSALHRRLLLHDAWVHAPHDMIDRRAAR